MGLRGKAIATAVPILIRRVCSAASASGRNPSLPASIDQRASKPALSAALAASGTSRKSRAESIVSSFIDSTSEDLNRRRGNRNRSQSRRESATTFGAAAELPRSGKIEGIAIQRQKDALEARGINAQRGGATNANDDASAAASPARPPHMWPPEPLRPGRLWISRRRHGNGPP